MDSKFPEGVSLQAFFNGKIIFQSKSHWLFPLFDLEDYLKDHPVDMALTEVHDKVIGKAAAILLLRLGVGCIYGNVMSELADTVLCHAGIPHFYRKLIEKIDCQTEELLLEIDDLDDAYGILCKRANRC
ncbi:MAG: DUF1893 domain-containing protein [Anaerolineaceae bacterium]